MVTSTIDPVETCQDLTIIQNSLLDRPIGLAWNILIKKKYKTYNIDKTWDLNRTVIYNHNGQGSFLFPLDIFMTKAVMIINNSQDEIIKPIDSIIKYLTMTIKSMCSVEVANIMKFTLNIYIPSNHKNDNLFHINSYINMIDENVEKTILNKKLDEKMRWYQIEFMFNDEWNLEKTNKSITNSRCF
jgi:hypothetical protein